MLSHNNRDINDWKCTVYTNIIVPRSLKNSSPNYKGINGTGYSYIIIHNNRYKDITS